MTKAEMAEWLALEFLKLKPWEQGLLPPDVEQFIYSPDGFFAVWDAVEEKLEGGEDSTGAFAEALHGINFSPKECGRDCCAITTSRQKSYGRGITRIEAFYNAVHEAMKEGK